jgi:hypothetical protein
MQFTYPITERRKAANSTYPISDRKSIEPYKNEYRSQTNRALRGQIFRTKILPAIYNHWRADEREPTSDLESAARIKVLRFSTINKFDYITMFRNSPHGLRTTGDPWLLKKQLRNSP